MCVCVCNVQPANRHRTWKTDTPTRVLPDSQGPCLLCSRGFPGGPSPWHYRDVTRPGASCAHSVPPGRGPAGDPVPDSRPAVSGCVMGGASKARPSLTFHVCYMLCIKRIFKNKCILHKLFSAELIFAVCGDRLLFAASLFQPHVCSRDLTSSFQRPENVSRSNQLFFPLHKEGLTSVAWEGELMCASL